MKKLVRALIAIIVVALCAGLGYAALRVREIHVVGTINRDPQEVRDLSLIQTGESIFTLNKKTVEENINKSPYFIVESIKVTGLNAVTITIKERVPIGIVGFGSYDLIIDEQGTVLQSTNHGMIDVGSLLKVDGVYVVSFGLGQQLSSSKPEQLDTLKALLEGIKEYGFEENVKGVNVASQTDVRLTTAEGINVKLGTMVQLERKLKWIEAAMPELRSRYSSDQLNGSSLDVPTADSAIFALKE